MRILIATGIFPPDIGGPAQYAKNLADVWQKAGHKVSVRAFATYRKFPSGIRHLLYFLSVLSYGMQSDFIFCPDTFSAAVPAVCAAKILGKKIIIRTGGDFLWEQYVERTGDLVLLRNFYTTRRGKLSRKERIVFSLIRFSLRHASEVVFSTKWQRDIFAAPYALDISKTKIIENYYGPKIASSAPTTKNFIGGTRPLKWKNGARIVEAFKKAEQVNSDIVYDTSTSNHEKFIDSIAHSYVVIIASLGDISPNTILDAIRANKPFILTRETGLYDKLKDIGLFVDPEDVADIADKITKLSDPSVYETYRAKVAAFTFTHTWEQIGEEILHLL